MIPYYDDFEELEEFTTKGTEVSGDYLIDPSVMEYILNFQNIDTKFNFKSMKYDKEASRLYFTSDFDDPNSAQEFENQLKEFLFSFVKREVKIPNAFFGKVKEEIEDKDDEFRTDLVNFCFDRSSVFFVGKEEDVAVKENLVCTIVNRLTEEAQRKSIDLPITDKNQLKFLNSIDYFDKLTTEFPRVQIHGTDDNSEKLLILGTAEDISIVERKILYDLLQMSEIEVKLSDHQINFLNITECKTVNDELKKNAVMLMLVQGKETVGGDNGLQAKIFSMKKCNDTEVK